MQAETLSGSLRLRRIYALILRQYYLVRGSSSKIIELFFWPLMNFIVWGYLSQYLMQTASTPLLAFGVLLAGGMFWEMLFRSQFAVVLGTLEELWSRNLAQLFIAPLRPMDYLIGMVLISLLRTTVIMLPCAIAVHYMFGFSLLTLGLPCLAFYFLQLMSGWWMGIMLSALLFRHGLTVEWMAWIVGFILLPLTGAYYPVSVLPVWLQPISWALPPTYVFEGMRSILQHGTFSTTLLWQSLGLNLLYLALACWGFTRAYAAARQHGSLLHGGE
jgi:ABC-2 type transport system permease protein